MSDTRRKHLAPSKYRKRNHTEVERAREAMKSNKQRRKSTKQALRRDWP